MASPDLISELDPIFPLPANTGIPPIKEGYGKDLFENDLHVAAGMTYRAFYTMWEQVERIAATNYPRYVGKGGTWELVAQTALEAVVWCRQIGNPNVRIEAISEKKAQKIRAKELKAEKERLAAAAAKRAKTGKKLAQTGKDPQDVDESVENGASDVPSDPSTKPKKSKKSKVKKKGKKK